MKTTFDAEANVIGACLMVPDAYWQCVDLLTGDDFTSEAHRELWKLIGTLAKAGVQADAVTVGDRNPALAAYAAECASATASAANVRAYAEIVQREAVTRRVHSAGTRISKLCGPDTLGEAQRIIATCVPGMATSIKPARDHLRTSIALMTERHAATEALTGLSTSIDELDEITSGWQPGDLILIGARPSVGKTALTLQVAAHAAQAGAPVLFLSLEMSGPQLTDRLLSHLAAVDSQFIRQPKRMPEADWARIGAASERVQQMPLLIDDTGALTIEGVCARVRQADATHRLGLVVIDYLTQMTPPKADRGDQAIQIITRALKALAKDLRIPIILLSQLNRAGDGEPTLVSLRESGAIEQDADVVILMHRPDAENKALVKCKVAKQRNGPTGDVWLHFDGAIQRFTPTDERPVVADSKKRQGLRAVPRDPIWGDAAT